MMSGENRPSYSFVRPNTSLFLTGAPLSGKSTLAPLIAGKIEGCGLQSMDIFRLLSQEIERHKEKSVQNPYVFYGSCDSYEITGDGRFTTENFINGFNAYAKAVSSLLTVVIPGLETQGVRDMLFEGVQLTPSIVFPFLDQKNKLIIIESEPTRLEQNRNNLYAGDTFLLERYSDEKLALLQEELLRQSKNLPKDRLLVVDNSGDYIDSVNTILQFLLDSKVIIKRG